MRKLIFIFYICLFLFQICFSIGVKFLSKEEKLQFERNYSDASFLQVNEGSQQNFPPLSKNEFQFRITTGILNGMIFEDPTFDDNNKIGPFINKINYDKIYKCNFAKNLVFGTTTLFHAISVKVRDIDAILGMKEELMIGKPIADFNELKTKVGDILAVGQHIFCHKEITQVEQRVDPNIEELSKSLRDTKQQFIDNLYVFIMNLISFKFPGADITKSSQTFSTYEQEIQDFWKKNHQDPEYLEVIMTATTNALSMVISQKDSDEVSLKFGTLFGEFAKAFFVFKHCLGSESPNLLVKRYGTVLYDRILTLMNSLEHYYKQDLDQVDLYDILRLSRHFLSAIGSSLLVGNSWYALFKEENFAGTIRTSLNLGARDIYQKSQSCNENYQTCSVLVEMEEILKSQQRIIDTLNEMIFTEEKVDNLLQYKEALQEIFNKICITEPMQCMTTLYNSSPRNSYNTYARVIQKIDNSWFKKLARLKKKGPITDIALSQNRQQQLDLIESGYTQLHVRPDSTMGLWICRMCGGDYVISSFKVEKGVIADFQTIVPNPTKIINIIQWMDQIVIVIEKILMTSTVLEPLKKPQMEHILSNIEFEEDFESTVWTDQNYEPSEIGLFTLFNTWDTDIMDWSHDDYPISQTLKQTHETDTMVFITNLAPECKEKLLNGYTGQVDRLGESPENHITIWYFRPFDPTQNEALKSDIKSTDECILQTQFLSEDYVLLTVIDSEMRDKIEEQKRQGNPYALRLRVERIPTYPLYGVGIWWWPFDKKQKEILRWDEVGLSDIRNLLLAESQIVYKRFERALCDKGANFCTYMDVGYSQFINQLVGPTPGFPWEAKSKNFGQATKPTAPSPINCQKEFEDMPEMTTPTIRDINYLLSSIIGGSNGLTYQQIQKLVEGECAASKVYNIEFMCNKKYKYIYLDVHKVMEVCIDSLIENDAEYRAVPEGSRVYL